MFNITFEDAEGKRQLVWQNSWGLTTRTIGVMVMVHSDDDGLVLPPRVAPIQAIVVPIMYNAQREELLAQTAAIVAELAAAGIRCESDTRSNYNPGWKFAHWELKGVPLRVEIGPNDIAKQQVVVVRRDQKANKVVTPRAQMISAIKSLLEQMQGDLYQRAVVERDSRCSRVTEWNDFLSALEARNTVLAPHCETRECEKSIKQRSGEAAKEDANNDTNDGEEKEEKGEKLTGAAKSLCIPFEQPPLPDKQVCIGCKLLAKNWTLFGRSY